MVVLKLFIIYIFNDYKTIFVQCVDFENQSYLLHISSILGILGKEHKYVPLFFLISSCHELASRILLTIYLANLKCKKTIYRPMVCLMDTLK